MGQGGKPCLALPSRAEPSRAMSRSSAVRELSLRDYKFYAKLVPLCFAFGAGMEFFMVKTGFYDKVAQLEAEKMAEHEAKREAFMELIKTPTREEKRKDASAGASQPSK